MYPTTVANSTLGIDYRIEHSNEPNIRLGGRSTTGYMNAMRKIENPVIIIPARMASTRLPGKPLADICGKPMITHVMDRALEADLGPVVIACSEQDVADAVTRAGGHAIMTDPDHPSGSDRIFEALTLFDPNGKHDAIVNLQGDLPTLEPDAVRACLAALNDASADIATLVAEITVDEERTNPNVVKAAVGFKAGERSARALYFSRATVPAEDGPHRHHIGIYAYRRDALARFCGLAARRLGTARAPRTITRP